MDYIRSTKSICIVIQKARTGKQENYRQRILTDGNLSKLFSNTLRKNNNSRFQKLLIRGLHNFPKDWVEVHLKGGFVRWASEKVSCFFFKNIIPCYFPKIPVWSSPPPCDTIHEKRNHTKPSYTLKANWKIPL